MEKVTFRRQAALQVRVHRLGVVTYLVKAVVCGSREVVCDKSWCWQALGSMLDRLEELCSGDTGDSGIG